MTALEQHSVFGVCGWSGSGKTTLIEAILPLLVQRGLSVAVVKHDVHGVGVDCRGADSDRFFQAGADVLLEGPREQFFRRHCPSVDSDPGAWVDLATRYDLVLVEGFKHLLFRKIWLLGEGEQSPPADVENIAAVLDRRCDRPARAWDLITGFLQRQVKEIAK